MLGLRFIKTLIDHLNKQPPAGTEVSWTPVLGADGYQVIRGRDNKPWMVDKAKQRPFTWAVWWRIVGPTGYASAWNDEPRKYRSEKAARAAAKDLNKLARQTLSHIQYVALPIEMRPHWVANLNPPYTSGLNRHDLYS